MKTERKNYIPSRTKFLLTGGLKAAINALISGVFLFYGHRLFQKILSIWSHGFQMPDLSGPSVILGLFADLLLMLLIGLFSFLPAFIGGILLAWWIRRENMRDQTNDWKLWGKGALIGASTGAILALLSLVPSYKFNMAAPNGSELLPIREIPKYVLSAVEIIIVAALAGAWTDKQLRKHLKNAASQETREMISET